MAAILLVAVDTDRATWTIQYMFYNLSKYTSGHRQHRRLHIIVKAITSSSSLVTCPHRRSQYFGMGAPNYASVTVLQTFETFAGGLGALWARQQLPDSRVEPQSDIQIAKQRWHCIWGAFCKCCKPQIHWYEYMIYIKCRWNVLYSDERTRLKCLITQGAKPGFWVKTGTACCKRFDAKKHIYTYLGTNCTWTTLTDFCWKFVGTI